MYELKAVIDRFEGNKVVIKTQNGQEILWPRENLPQETKEGSWIKLVLKTSASDKEEREKLAKTLLNEILNNRSQ